MTSDQLEIRALSENWAMWRDSRQWDRFRTVWHSDGQMMATWWHGPFEEFIAMSQAAFANGVRVSHFLGGCTVDVRDDRATCQTQMTITQRAPVEGVLCDVVCTGRFYDLVERRDGRWGIVLRQPIYETDRLDPVIPGTVPQLDLDKLATFPEGYRHLAYLQSGIGYDIKLDMPGREGPELEVLYARGAEWLDGASSGQ